MGIRNRTMTLSQDQTELAERQFFKPQELPIQAHHCSDQVAALDVIALLPQLADSLFDLIIADPPYDLTKTFGTRQFKAMGAPAYTDWLQTWVPDLARVAKDGASVYVCGDWRSSGALERVLGQYFTIQNRITWEREKGRGSLHNWKNASEDIWFCTKGPKYVFNAEQVKLRRRVVAPYRQDGQPRDWVADSEPYRDTLPSNLWTDCTVPFWSMPENTPHPTQKPEKLIAKLILASSQVGDLVFDPFGGSGTTAVVARKLQRHFFLVEQEPEYAALALARLALAANNPSIQGLEEGVFHDRNYRANHSRTSSQVAP